MQSSAHQTSSAIHALGSDIWTSSFAIQSREAAVDAVHTRMLLEAIVDAQTPLEAAVQERQPSVPAILERQPLTPPVLELEPPLHTDVLTPTLPFPPCPSATCRPSRISSAYRTTLPQAHAQPFSTPSVVV